MSKKVMALKTIIISETLKHVKRQRRVEPILALANFESFYFEVARQILYKKKQWPNGFDLQQKCYYVKTLKVYFQVCIISVIFQIVWTTWMSFHGWIQNQAQTWIRVKVKMYPTGYYDILLF